MTVEMWFLGISSSKKSSIIAQVTEPERRLFWKKG
jgi:hypothetical protein